jgi:hypothetical protein
MGAGKVRSANLPRYDAHPGVNTSTSYVSNIVKTTIFFIFSRTQPSHISEISPSSHRHLTQATTPLSKEY